MLYLWEDGERRSLTYPDRRTVCYGFDGNLRLSGLKDGVNLESRISYVVDLTAEKKRRLTIFRMK